MLGVFHRQISPLERFVFEIGKSMELSSRGAQELDSGLVRLANCHAIDTSELEPLESSIFDIQEDSFAVST